MTLLRSSTGEAWNAIMHEMATAPEGCNPHPMYDARVCAYSGREYDCQPLDGCGTPLSFLYFVSFSILVR
jgi:hypothetical protein